MVFFFYTGKVINNDFLDTVPDILFVEYDVFYKISHPHIWGIPMEFHGIPGFLEFKNCLETQHTAAGRTPLEVQTAADSSSRKESLES
jgi:hypothetical protein